MLVLVVLACIVVPAVGLMIRRAINHTTSQIRAMVDAAAGGDLTQQVTVAGEDSVGRMAAGMARFLSHLRASIGGIDTRWPERRVGRAGHDLRIYLPGAFASEPVAHPPAGDPPDDLRRPRPS
jgi:HAMP domain-containing protein